MVSVFSSIQLFRSVVPVRVLIQIAANATVSTCSRRLLAKGILSFDMARVNFMAGC